MDHETAPPAPPAVRIGQDALHGTHRQPGAALALLRDGDLLAITTAAGDGAYSLPLPAHALAGLLDVIEVGTGRSILADPVDLADIRPVEWLGWTCRNQRIEGAFRLRDVPPGPILVDADTEDGLLFQAVAQPEADGVYRFQGRLFVLPRADAVLTLHPRVGGLPIEDPLAVSVLDLGAAGELDRFTGSEARGWLADPSTPARRLDVEIWLNGRPAGRVTPGLMREDLKDLGLDDGSSGFVFPFPPGLDRSGLVKVQAFVADTGMELPGSPYLLDLPTNIVGCVDRISDQGASGWAIDLADPMAPVPLEALCGDLVVGTVRTGLPRADVLQSGMPTADCGFLLRFTAPPATLLDRDIVVRAAGTSVVLDGPTRRMEPDGAVIRFLTRRERIAPAVQRRLAAAVTRRTAAAPLTIILPVGGTSRERLSGIIAQLAAQWSANWQLVCIDDGTRPAVTALLSAAAHDDRLRIVTPTPGENPVACGLAAATSPWTLILDPEVTLEPDAVQRLSQAAIATGADVIYADEALTAEHPGAILDVVARPAFSLDHLLSRPRDPCPIAYRTGLLLQAVPASGAALPAVETMLLALAAAATVAHVPGVLARRRLAQAPLPDAALQSMVRRFLEATGRSATVSDGLVPGECRIDWPDDEAEVLLVIRAWDDPARLRTCLDSIENTTRTTAGLRVVLVDHAETSAEMADLLRDAPAHYARLRYPHPRTSTSMDNMAVREQAGAARYLLFVDPGVEALHEGWVQRLRSLVARPGIGAAGPLLLHPGGTVRQAGLLLSMNGTADKSMDGHPATLPSGARNPGYHGNLTTLRDTSAVTAACLMVRRDVFEAVGGFDEAYKVGFNGTDLCLRIIDAGYHVLIDGHTTLIQHEEMQDPLATGNLDDERRLASRWGRYFRDGDPFYSPLLSDTHPDHVLREDDGCRGKMRPRLVSLAGPPALPLPGATPKKPAAKPKAKPRGRA